MKLDSVSDKKKKRILPKGARRKRYLTMFYSAVGLVMFSFIIPLFVGKKDVTAVTDSSLGFGTNISLVVTQKEYNSKNHTIKTQFYIGNPSDVDDVTNAKDLSNVKYKVNAVTQKGNQETLETNAKKVNDNYLEVVTKNVDPEFKIIRYEITPMKINSKVDTNISKSAMVKLYVKDKDLTKTSSDLSLNGSSMQQDYLNYIVKNYQQSIKDLEKQVAKSKETIKQDRKTISSLDIRKVSAVGEAKTEIKNQIEDLKQDVQLQNDAIKETQKSISEYKKKIDKIKENK